MKFFNKLSKKILKHKKVIIITLVLFLYIIFHFRKNIDQKEKIIKKTKDFDIINVTSHNDHYGFWKSSPIYNNPNDAEAKVIRKLQASYLHKKKPIVYKYKNTYTCVGFGLANSVFIVTKSCVIVNDVGTDTVQGDAMIKVIKSVTNLPVKYVIFGHNHIDHTGGIGSYVKEWPNLKIIAHKNITYNIENTSTVISNILGIRSGKHAGINVPNKLFDHAGIGPHKEVNTQFSTYRKPDIVLDNNTVEKTLCGLNMIFMWAPSETDDELCIYLPSEKILLTNEIINPSAPSSYTLRGTKRRDIKVWIDTLTKMLNEFGDAQYMAPTHGRPVIGNTNVVKRIKEYRDGTNDMYEKTMKLINEGKLPDEIEHLVKVDNKYNVPWNYYDHYNFQASFPKAIYQNYLGHYNGDPYTLLIHQESHPHERACYYSQNTQEVFEKVNTLINENQKAFAAELLTFIIDCTKSKPEDIEKAKKLKSKLYMELADKQTSSNLRNWLINDSLLLENKIKPQNINFKVKKV